MSKTVDIRKKTLTLSLSQSIGRGDQNGNGHQRLPFPSALFTNATRNLNLIVRH